MRLSEKYKVIKEKNPLKTFLGSGITEIRESMKKKRERKLLYRTLLIFKFSFSSSSYKWAYFFLQLGSFYFRTRIIALTIYIFSGLKRTGTKKKKSANFDECVNVCNVSFLF